MYLVSLPYLLTSSQQAHLRAGGTLQCLTLQTRKWVRGVMPHTAH